MLWGGTSTTTTNNQCQCNGTACPWCYGTMYVGGNYAVVNLWTTTDAKQDKPAIPFWLAELRRTPRRMKRPFPADKPGNVKAHRRPCY
jgi:hypothetical protein